jgi:hypothetical protein
MHAPDSCVRFLERRRAVLLLCLAVSACRPDLPVPVPEGDPLPMERVVTDDFDLRIIQHDELPYIGYELSEITFPDDHPVFLIDRSLTFLDNYRSSGRHEYLAAAQECVARLLALSRTHNGALYFAYQSDFELHGDSGDIMSAPWYSGMAQGMALSALSRLHTVTGDSTYMATAELVLRSFFEVEGSADVWTASVDPEGYYWIDEYPHSSNAFTLNGFIFAVMGLYDYWLIRPSPEVERLLRASATTLKHYVERFRNPGGISRYCLRHGALSKKYHLVHIGQLLFLHRMTGDEYFMEMAVRFDDDCCAFHPFSTPDVRLPGFGPDRG